MSMPSNYNNCVEGKIKSLETQIISMKSIIKHLDKRVGKLENPVKLGTILKEGMRKC